MKRGALVVLFLCLFFVTAASTLAQNEVYSLPLLAVQETPNGSYAGSQAELYLEIQEGSGRVFLDTSPLTKVDTQVSTRYAKEIACEYFDLDCNNYDFIYTIRATSSIIGGPSAGAAMAALTAIAVLDLSYDESVAITGTINSGGIVGPVGGVQEKVRTAAQGDLSKVLIPFGGLDMPQVSENETVSLELNPFSQVTNDPSVEFGISVHEVGDLNEVIFHLTGKELRTNGQEITVDEGYTSIMRQLDEKLCERVEELESELFGVDLDGAGLDVENLDTKKEQAASARVQEDYYSAASFCFGLNIQLQYHLNIAHNLSESLQVQEKKALESSIASVSARVNVEKITTISDLQTKIVVEERLSEAQNILDEINESSDPLYALAYAHERLYSAISWMNFFQMQGREFTVDNVALEETCNKKIAQANERYNYATIYISEARIRHIKEKIDDAQSSYEQKEHELCLVKASQAKAESNSILSSLGLTNSTFQDSLTRKMVAVEHLIADQSSQDIFPILGYSYYQYANSLKEDEPYSALLYLEYALELSDFAIYFDEEMTEFSFPELNLSSQEWFIFGLFLGGGIVWFSFTKGKRKKKKR